MVRVMTLTDMAERLNRDFRQRGDLPAAFFITDQKAIPEPERIIEGLPKNCAVIFRDYDYPDRKNLGQSLRKLCNKKSLLFLVAGDENLAANLNAGGLHLPEALMRNANNIRKRHPRWLITASCHHLTTLKEAENISLDAGLISPVFPTYSHPETYTGKQATLGPSGVRQMTAATTLPLYALGGITRENARQLIGSGIAGIAAIRGFEEN